MTDENTSSTSTSTSGDGLLGILREQGEMGSILHAGMLRERSPARAQDSGGADPWDQLVIGPSSCAVVWPGQGPGVGVGVGAGVVSQRTMPSEQELGDSSAQPHLDSSINDASPHGGGRVAGTPRAEPVEGSEVVLAEPGVPLVVHAHAGGSDSQRWMALPHASSSQNPDNIITKSSSAKFDSLSHSVRHHGGQSPEVLGTCQAPPQSPGSVTSSLSQSVMGEFCEATGLSRDRARKFFQ